MHSIPIPRGLLPSRARYASECEGKNTKYFLSDQTVIRNISLQFDYYAKNNWIDLDISYYKDWEKDSMPAMFSILIPRTLLTDTNQFYLMFVNTLSDTTGGVIKHLFSWEETYHEVYEEDCYIRLPLPVVLAYIEKTDGIVIHYAEGNQGVMHSTYVFKEQYLDYLKEYCKGIKSYLND